MSTRFTTSEPGGSSFEDQFPLTPPPAHAKTGGDLPSHEDDGFRRPDAISSRMFAQPFHKQESSKPPDLIDLKRLEHELSPEFTRFIIDAIRLHQDTMPGRGLLSSFIEEISQRSPLFQSLAPENIPEDKRIPLFYLIANAVERDLTTLNDHRIVTTNMPIDGRFWNSDAVVKPAFGVVGISPMPLFSVHEKTGEASLGILQAAEFVDLVRVGLFVPQRVDGKPRISPGVIVQLTTSDHMANTPDNSVVINRHCLVAGPTGVYASNGLDPRVILLASCELQRFLEDHSRQKSLREMVEGYSRGIDRIR